MSFELRTPRLLFLMSLYRVSLRSPCGCESFSKSLSETFILGFFEALTSATTESGSSHRSSSLPLRAFRSLSFYCL